MTLKKIVRNEKGAAMAWAIVFGLVVFAIVALIISMMTAFRLNAKIVQKSDQRHNDLNQIGEYFVRAVGSKSEFLEGTNFTKATLQGLNKATYPWLDNEAIDFFDRCNTDYGYTYLCQYGNNNQGSFWNFYRDEGRSRKLTVKKGGNALLSIVVSENITYDESRPLILTSSYNPVTTFEILEWTVNDEISDLGGDKTNFLQQIWQWIGGIFGRVEVSTKNYSVTFDYDSEKSGIQTKFSQYPQGTTITLPTPSADGYQFLRWSDGNNHTYAAGAQYTVNKTVTLTAVWQVYTGPSYSVIFHKNDGTSTIDTETINSNSINISGSHNFDDRNGYSWIGWSESPNGTALNLSTYTFAETAEEVHLYAVWQNKTFNVTCDGSNVGSYTFDPAQDQSVPIAYTPDTGKTFAVSNPSQGNVNSSDNQKIDIPKGTYGDISVTVTQSWVDYSISAGSHTNGGSYTLSNRANATAHYGETVSFTATATNGVNSVTVKAQSGDQTYVCTESGGTYSFSMPNCDVTIKVNGKEGGGNCCASGTLITLADGTQKKIEEITLCDTVMVFNHETGKTESANINFIEADGWDNYKIINLEWSNGSKSRIIFEHGFFDLDLMKYVYIHEDDYEQYIGHRFYSGKYENGEYKSCEVVLNNAYVTQEYTGCYSFPTVYHLNYFIEDMLSMPGGIAGMFNIFDFDADLKYNAEKMEADIAEYGLFDYQNIAEYISYETFCKYPAQYLYVSLNKGLLTEDDLQYLIQRYAVKYE